MTLTDQWIQLRDHYQVCANAVQARLDESYSKLDEIALRDFLDLIAICNKHIKEAANA